MERAEFQHEQKANVRNSGEGLFTKTDSYTETKNLLKKKSTLTRVCSVRQSSRTYPTSPSERYADFGKSGAESGTRPSEQACNERQNPDKDLKRMQGCEPPTIQEAGALTKRHSEDEVRRIPYLFLKRFFAKYNFPFIGNYIKPAQNDSNFLVPQCLSNLVPFCPLSLPSPSRGEGCKTAKNLFTHSPIHLFTPKKKAAFTLTEVLVALSIVGIIAALVLPAVITNYQNKSFNQAFQRETQTLQSTIEGLPVSENKANFFDTMMYKATMETDETTGAANYDDSSKAFMQKYLKVSKFCGTNTDCFAEKYYEYTDGDKKVYTPDFKGACAKLKNGMSICLTPQVGIPSIESVTDLNCVKEPNVAGNKVVYPPEMNLCLAQLGETTPIEGVIDLNGAKGPNVFGKDLRTFMISAFVKNGRNTTTDTVLSYDFDPIVPEEEETDPCEGKTCGCGSLPDCPTCETTPESSWSEECCLANTSKITPGHHCCSFSSFSSSSYCKKQCGTDSSTWDETCCKENSSSVNSPAHHCCSFSSFRSSEVCDYELITATANLECDESNNCPQGEVYIFEQSAPFAMPFEVYLNSKYVGGCTVAAGSRRCSFSTVTPGKSFLMGNCKYENGIAQVSMTYSVGSIASCFNFGSGITYAGKGYRYPIYKFNGKFYALNTLYHPYFVSPSYMR